MYLAADREIDMSNYISAMPIFVASCFPLPSNINPKIFLHLAVTSERLPERFIDFDRLRKGVRLPAGEELWKNNGKQMKHDFPIIWVTW